MRFPFGSLLVVLLTVPASVTAEPVPARLVEPPVDRVMQLACEQLRSAPAFSVEAEIRVNGTCNDCNSENGEQLKTALWVYRP